MADVLFINPTEKLTLNHEVNGTLLLATKLLQAGIDTKVLRFCEIESYSQNLDYETFIKDIVARIIELRPKVVSFYTLWSTYHIMLRIAKELKYIDSSVIIVLGGPQSSATAEDTLLAVDYVDVISTGEGENTVVPLFKLLLSGDFEGLSEIPSLYYRKNGKIVFNHTAVPLCDLNTLPYWDKRLLTEYHGRGEANITSPTYFMPIDAGRGCPYGCTFCCTSRFWKRTYRLKSPQRIVEDLMYYNSEYGIKSFWFTHDAFTVNNQLVEDICDEIINRGIEIYWRCTSRIDRITKELILKMKKAGLRGIEVGIETGSNRMQSIINKKLDLNKAREMIEFLLENKIQVNLFFVYGFPEETEEDLNETLEFMFDMLDMGIYGASLNICRFNPGTAITGENIDKLVLDHDIKVLHRRVFGYKEELPMIEKNKALFPFYYHLPTKVRNEYHNLGVLAFIYQQFPISMRYLRALYKKDNLRFYKDFVTKNADIFSLDIDLTLQKLRENPLDALYNVIDTFDVPYKTQLKELMRYDFDRRKFFARKGDVDEMKTYSFNFLDLKRKLPIEQYGEAVSTILFSKTGGAMKVQVLNVR